MAKDNRLHPWPLRRRALKRAFDVVAAGAGLAVCALPLVLLGIAVRLGSRGSAVYSQVRMGRGGRPFVFYKLRTMVDGADRRGPAVTCDGDPRVTPLGLLLRRSKLDELPQLWNIVRGDMSLVGPRPEVPRYRDAYRSEDEIVLAVRPGLTDDASIAFRHEERLLAAVAAEHTGGDRDRAYRERLLPEKLALARRYVEQQSFLHDLSVLARTAVAVIR